MYTIRPGETYTREVYKHTETYAYEKRPTKEVKTHKKRPMRTKREESNKRELDI